MGYTKSCPIDLRYGKHTIGSIRIPNLYLEQFTQQLNIFLRTLNHHETEQLMDNIITMYKMQIGLEGDPLEDPEPQVYTDG